MPEGLSVPEVAHHATHRHSREHDKEDKGRREELIEILEAVLLAIVAISTAWSGYQTGRWDGREAHLYGDSSTHRVLASQAATRSGQGQLYDASVFSFWLQARETGDAAHAEVFARRFRPAFLPAFRAWLATDPFHNAKAPPGPQVMPQYRPPGAARARAYDAKAAHEFEQGAFAREHGDQYLRDTILLATVLFLTAIASRFKVRAVRVGLLGVSGVLLLAALGLMLTYPVA